jgi:hypothetical protein
MHSSIHFKYKNITRFQGGFHESTRSHQSKFFSIDSFDEREREREKEANSLQVMPVPKVTY